MADFVSDEEKWHVQALFDVCLDTVVALHQARLAERYYPRSRAGSLNIKRPGQVADRRHVMNDEYLGNLNVMITEARRLAIAVMNSGPDQYTAIKQAYLAKTARTQKRRKARRKPKQRRVTTRTRTTVARNTH